jgi:hypothetical protein
LPGRETLWTLGMDALSRDGLLVWEAMPEVVLRADPTVDICHSREIEWVIKAGRPVPR